MDIQSSQYVSGQEAAQSSILIEMFYSMEHSFTVLETNAVVFVSGQTPLSTICSLNAALHQLVQ